MLPPFGAHLYLWQKHVDTDSLLARLDDCHSLGLSFLEIPLGDDVTFDHTRVGEAARSADIQLVVSPGGEWPTACDLSLPGTAGLEWHRRQLQIAASCGAMAYTGALYGHPGTVLREPHAAKDSQRTADNLALLAETARHLHITLALEPMSHFRTHIANTPAQIVHLIDLAGSPANLQLLFDTYHLCTEITSYAEALQTALPRLWGLHACENNRGIPGTGFLPWREIVGTLSAHGWEGYIGFESYNSTCEGGQFAVSRGMFHNVCPDGNAFIHQASAFLCSLWSPSPDHSSRPGPS